MKFFWILSDNKTVREITEREYLKMLGRKDRKIGWIDETAVLLRQEDSILLSPCQLRQIMKMQPLPNQKVTP